MVTSISNVPGSPSGIRRIVHMGLSYQQSLARKRTFFTGLLIFFMASIGYAGPRWGGFVADFQAGLATGYDSNIISTDDGASDFFYNGSLDMTVRRDRSDANWELIFGTDLFRFSSEDQENSEDFQVGLNFFPLEPRFASRIQTDGSISWSRLTESDPRLGIRYQRDRFSVNAGALYSPNSKRSLRLDGSYSWEDPRRTLTNVPLAEVSSWSVGLTGFYRQSQKLAYTLSGTFSDTSGNRVNNPFQSGNSGFSVSLGMDGQITPKISGTFSLGWQFQDSDLSTASDSHPFISSGLTWTLDSLTSLTLNASTQTTTTLGDQLSEDMSLDIGVRRQFNSRYSGNLSLSWRKSDIRSLSENRSDDFYSITARNTYNLNPWINIMGILSWTQQDSTRDVSSFDQFRAEISLNWTY